MINHFGSITILFIGVEIISCQKCFGLDFVFKIHDYFSNGKNDEDFLTAINTITKKAKKRNH